MWTQTTEEEKKAELVTTDGPNEPNPQPVLTKVDDTQGPQLFLVLKLELFLQIVNIASVSLLMN